jgi:uncharacterized integral membrane protein
MEMSIDQEPQKLAEIEAKKTRLETELNSLNRRKKTIIYCFIFLLTVLLISSIFNISQLKLDRPVVHIFDTLPFVLVVLLSAIFSLVFIIKIDSKIHEKESGLSQLEPIDESNAAEIVEFCMAHPEIDKYRSQVVSLHRSLIEAEFEAIQKWAAESPGKTAFEHLQSPGPIQNQIKKAQ